MDNYEQGFVQDFSQGGDVDVCKGHTRYPRFQALSSKWGGGESLVTFAGKAVNLWCVIIHVIYVGCSHFSNNFHVI